MKRSRSRRRVTGWGGTAVFVAAFFFFGSGVCAEVMVADPLARVKRSLETSRSLSDYTAVLVKRERFEGSLAPEEEILFKYAQPGRVYMRWIGKVNKGQEALYVKGENEDRLKAHKGGFLGLVTVNVDPTGKMAMEGQHHPIFHAGIVFTTEVVLRDLEKGLSRNEVRVMDRGRQILDGREVVVVEAFFPEEVKGAVHTVKKGETLWDVAAQYDQDMFVILSVNKGVDTPQDVREGQALRIPDYYCRRSVSYYDAASELLVKIENYDWNNTLYEAYHYRDLQLNVGLSSYDFDPDNKGYSF
ncbi:DUF1571 domain-containing protein [Desulfoluna butyratoxydans]|uniref:LysM domain-containing protein n=1 Tax=Desulfoluna butyratoxydans TaxID=231438 RepID=A0A4U8YY18_9BACT|nr:DUF1571 domain-containing protein [Desulfoluna butyratoxydans]VFQ46982.1 protein of unknown function duf1571 [Desulfoluna butyratoxydans]